MSELEKIESAFKVLVGKRVLRSGFGYDFVRVRVTDGERKEFECCGSEESTVREENRIQVRENLEGIVGSGENQLP